MADEDTYRVITPDADSPTVIYDDIIGLPACKELLDRIVGKPLKNPDFYTGIVKRARFFALYGPVGSGKRSLVEAFAWILKLVVIEVTLEDITQGIFKRILTKCVELDTPTIVLFDHCGVFLQSGTVGLRDLRRQVRVFEGRLDKVWFAWVTAERPQTLPAEVQQENTAYAQPLTESEFQQLYQKILSTHADWMKGEISLERERLNQLVEASHFCTASDVYEYCQRVFTCPYDVLSMSAFRRKRRRTELSPKWEHFQQCLYSTEVGWRITKGDPAEIRRIYEQDRLQEREGGIASGLGGIRAQLLSQDAFPIQQ